VSAQPFIGDVVGQDFALFVPLSMQPKIMREEAVRNEASVSWLSLIGRLKPGVSSEQAKANINLIFQQAIRGRFGAGLSADDRDTLSKQQIAVSSGSSGLSRFRADYRLPLLLLMGIVGLVLLIACVNVANLLLARARTRRKELAVRLAIGASQRRLLQQLLTESVLLSLVGGIFGSLLAVWGVRLLIALFGSDAELLPLSPDIRVLSFTLGVSLLTGLLFGIVPALNALRVEVHPGLKGMPAPDLGIRSRFHWGKALIAGQVALSLVVLFGATLLVRSLENLLTQDLGYDRKHILLIHPRASDAGYKSKAMRQLAEELRTRISTLPGVRGACYSSLGLFSGGESSDKVIVPGFTALTPEDYSVAQDSVSPDYFSVMGIPILLGRGISQQDGETSSRVAVINEAMRKRFFHDDNPLGRQFEIDDPAEKGKPFTVIGVSRDAKDHSEFLRNAAVPRFYFAFQQYSAPRHFVLEVVTGADPNMVFAEVREQINAADPHLPIYSMYTVTQLLEKSVGNQIALARLSAFFAGLAVLLACVGLYGIMSYTVAARTREIGIRVALGARRLDLIQLVVREGMLLVVIGICVGIPISLTSSRVLHSFLFGLRETDPVSLVLVIVLLGMVAAMAAMLPARRATKVDPMVALRQE